MGNRQHFYVADFSSCEIKNGGKRLPRYEPRRRPPTVADFEAHLNDGPGLLIVPVDEDGRCRRGVIDLDDYGVDASGVARRVAKLKFPLSVECTKSGGVHIVWYLQFARPAHEVRARMAEFAAALGFTNAEIFPKQDRLGPDELGSGINLPYRGGDRADNCALDEDGRRLSLVAFLDRVERLRDAPLPASSTVSHERAIDVLAEFWTSGQRHNLCLAALGTMLTRGIETDVAQEIIEGAMDHAGDEERGDPQQRPTAKAIARDLESGKRIPNVGKLREILGERITDFLSAIGMAKDIMPLSFPPLAAEYLDQRPAPLEFTVERLLPRGVVGLLIAEGGSGKTTFALRAALCVAGARPLFGLQVRPGRAVYVGLEDNPTSLWRRVFAVWSREQERMRMEKLPPEAIDHVRARLLDNLIVESAVGHELHLVRTFHDQAHQSQILDQFIQQIPRPVELLAIDPMSRLHGGEENSNALGTALINAGERIARVVGCTVLIAHHTGKAAAKGRDESLYAARGASGFADAARSVIRLLVANAEDVAGFSNIDAATVARGDVVKIIHAKCNDAARSPDLWLRRRELDFELWEPESSADGGAGRDLVALHLWWINSGRKPFTKAEVEDARTRILGGGATKERARAALAHGQREGVVVEGGEAKARSRYPTLTFRPDWDPDAL